MRTRRPPPPPSPPGGFPGRRWLLGAEALAIAPATYVTGAFTLSALENALRPKLLALVVGQGSPVLFGAFALAGLWWMLLARILPRAGRVPRPVALASYACGLYALFRAAPFLGRSPLWLLMFLAPVVVGAHQVGSLVAGARADPQGAARREDVEVPPPTTEGARLSRGLRLVLGLEGIAILPTTFAAVVMLLEQVRRAAGGRRPANANVWLEFTAAMLLAFAVGVLWWMLLVRASDSGGRVPRGLAVTGFACGLFAFVGLTFHSPLILWPHVFLLYPLPSLLVGLHQLVWTLRADCAREPRRRALVNDHPPG